MIINFLPGLVYKAKQNGFFLVPVAVDDDSHLLGIVYERDGGFALLRLNLSSGRASGRSDYAFGMIKGGAVFFHSGDVLSEQELNLFRCRLGMGSIDQIRSF